MSKPTATRELYGQYVTRMQMIADIRYSSAVLQWDQETYLPPKGAVFRGQQIATLSELAHKYFTGPVTGELIRELMEREDLTREERRNIECSQDDYSRLKKLSSTFVRELTEAVNRSFHSWIRARKANDFSEFSEDLASLIALKKQEADFLGYTGHRYNALLDEFDKGSNVNLLDKTFNEVRDPLKELLDKIMGMAQMDDSFLKGHFPEKKQWDFGLKLLRELGYDFEAGRQDISEHPFTTNFNSRDVRVTTRISESDFTSMTWSCIHELGHALYEQGLPESQYGLPLGEPASLSIHESQSRLWENHIGRSLAFCSRHLPELKGLFPSQFEDISIQQFYQGINKVQPSLIRTEADELTYHFHIIIRYELEKLLIGGELKTDDIPAFWNEQYKRYLGITVPDDKTGCLQDVHWSHGSFGYFPTYSLGSFYAAQFYQLAEKEAHETGNDGQPDTAGLLSWLRTNIHSRGRKFESEALCREVTGEPLNIQYFLQYLVDKYQNIYNF